MNETTDKSTPDVHEGAAKEIEQTPENAVDMHQEAPKGLRRRLQGVVVSVKCEKSAVVRVSRPKMHKRYLKQMKWSKNYMSHDEKNVCKQGDVVEICECVPKSKNKHFEVMRVLEKTRGV